jgi:calpain
MIIDKDLASSLSKGVYPPIFHKHRSNGLYVLRFFKNFEWIYVIIDDRLPVVKATNKPIFGTCTNANELWVPLIEKAYAKLHGCYEQLISGYVDEGICDLTAFQAEKIIIKNEKTGEFPHKTIADHYGGEEGFW